jgi:hypothetical protein
MVCNLSRGISGLVLSALGIWFASQPAAAYDLDIKPYGAYALTASPSDKVKEVIEYDNHSHVTKDMIIPSWGSNKGLKIVAYYPGGKSIRMKASGDWYTTTATYYRPNHTRESVLSMSYGATTVDWYNETGTKILLRQIWFKTDVDQGSQPWMSPTKHQYKLWYVEEKDRSGNPERAYTLYPDTATPQFIEQYNVKVPGDWSSFLYRRDGTLELKTYHRSQRSDIAREEHSAAEGIVAPHVPANLLRVPSHLDEDDFPELLLPETWR